MEFYQQQLDEIYKKFHTSPTTGLDSRHLKEHRVTYGTNTLEKKKQTSWVKLLVQQFADVLVIILLIAAIVSALLGEWIDTVAIIVILLINGIIGFIQEWKAQASIAALQKLASSKATVIRDGKTVHVDAEDLVPGDILILQTGDRVPADARLIEAIALEAQEGALTGESVPVEKHTKVIKEKTGIGDQKNLVFSGTVITKGRGKAVVVGTGMRSEIGKIANLIQEATQEDTPLQKQLDKLGSKLGKITIAICVAIFGIITFVQGTFTLESLREPFLLAISLAVAAIPEGLPIVVTIALSIGTQRMAKKHALVKQLPAVEALGSTTVICTDKTGTLTKNEMTVTTVYYSNKTIDVAGTGYKPEGKVNGHLPRISYEISALCNDAELITEKSEFSVAGDPTEGCLLTLARKGGFSEKELRQKHPRIGEIPFDSKRKRMSTVNVFGHKHLLLTKGAPDMLLKHCTHILDSHGVRKITAHDKEHILQQNETYAQSALRVLGYAFKEIHKKDKYTEKDENHLTFVNLVGMIDPPRKEAIAAVKQCKAAGIRVVMITGDHKSTALAIAKELGIEGKAITGEELANINLYKEAEHISIYARVNPEDKLHIVEALQKRGEVVAMTGDGVNDAPALKKADIGIAMGITGTDVAKESAAMILTDDNFASIVKAVEEGRNIYQNIKKFVNYLLSSNLAEVLVMLVAILIFSAGGEVVWPLIPIMILYMNLLTDSLPALALGVDPGDKKAMKKAPRDPKEPIITRNMQWNILLIGVLVTTATVFVFKWALDTQGIEHARSVALTTLVVLELVRLAMIRRQYNTPFWSNKWLFLSIVIVFLLQAAVLYVPFMQLIFKTTALQLMDWLVIVGTGIVTYIVGMIIGGIVRKITAQID